MIFTNDRLDEIQKKDLFPRALCRDLVAQMRTFNKVKEILLREKSLTIEADTQTLFFKCIFCDELFKSLDHECIRDTI